MLDRLLRDHVIMREKAETLMRLLESETMPDSAVLADARWQLGSLIMKHLAFEDRHLYAKLLRDERPHVRETGRKFQSELASLFTTYAEHTQFWTPARIARDWDGFRTVSRRLNLAFSARIEREEAELYPLAADAAIDMATNVAPATNWTREAFAIKDAITEQLPRAGG